MRVNPNKTIMTKEGKPNYGHLHDEGSVTYYERSGKREVARIHDRMRRYMVRDMSEVFAQNDPPLGPEENRRPDAVKLDRPE